MLVQSLAVGPFMANCYVVGCEATRKGVIIDPGDEIARIAIRVEEMKLEITAILATHGHLDHIGAAAEAVRRFDAGFYLHRDDYFFAEDLNRRSMMWGLGPKSPPPLEHPLADGDEITVGTLAFRVMHTPGHSPGSVCFHCGAHLFTGDTLFAGSVGRTDFEGGSAEALMMSIKERILTLPEDTRLYPGHESETTIAQERRHNPFITGRAFI